MTIPEGYGAIGKTTKQIVYLNSKISEGSRNGPGESCTGARLGDPCS